MNGCVTALSYLMVIGKIIVRFLLLEYLASIATYSAKSAAGEYWTATYYVHRMALCGQFMVMLRTKLSYTLYTHINVDNAESKSGSE